MFEPARSEPLKKSALKAKAVGWLARREHTRAELKKKLQPYAENFEAIIEVLDELERGGWQSDERFARAFCHHKSQKQGASLVAQGMRERGVPDDLIVESIESLRDSENDRARLVWEKKFSREGRPSDRKTWARQARFLASRGFGAAVISRVLGSDGDPTED